MQELRLVLPSLSLRYSVALRAALDYVFNEFQPFAVVVPDLLCVGTPILQAISTFIDTHGGVASRNGLTVFRRKFSLIRRSG